MSQYPASVAQAFESGQLTTIKAALSALPVATTPDGAKLIEGFDQAVDAVRYTNSGIEFQPASNTVTSLGESDVLILTTSVSLCGTDLGLIEKAKKGELPAEAVGRIVGHEGAGFIIGVGAKVTNWQIGQYVCLDSHYACGRPGHNTFEDCVNAGLSCDGIVGGIRGSLVDDHNHAPVKDGYWTRLIQVPASALPVELPLEIAQHLVAPSTLESLSNIYMMIGQIEKAGLLDKAAETVLIVSGLGATGYPMAAVGHHYGFTVVGVEVVEGKRTLAIERGACSTAYADITEVTAELVGKKNVVIAITADQPIAHQEALEWLDAQAGKFDQRVAIIFGLFADPALPLPTAPAEFQMPQRDFVFSRQHYVSAAGTEVYGVCGRDLPAWRKIMIDLMPDAAGNPPHLVEQLNQSVYTLPVADPLQEIAQTLNQGAGAVNELLKSHLSMKLAANLVKHS